MGSLQFHAPAKLVAGKTLAKERHFRGNAFAVVAALCGLAAILGSRAAAGKTLVPHALHSWVGVASLVLLVVQAAVGLDRYFRWGWLSAWVPFAWHRLAVLPTLALNAAATISGLLHVFNKPEALDNEAAIAYSGSALVLLSALAAAAALRDRYHMDNTVAYAAVSHSSANDASG